MSETDTAKGATAKSVPYTLPILSLPSTPPIPLCQGFPQRFHPSLQPALRPAPPGAGKDKDARWIDIYEGALDEAQMAEWVRQAAALPGWRGF